MKLPIRCECIALPLLLAGFVSSVTPAVCAQDKTIPSQKILTIQREFTKPGKEGAAHEKSEAAFAKAMADGKVTDHYYALTSLSGRPRVLFLSAYPSFADIEAERKKVNSNASLSAELDRANEADGDLLAETNSSMWMRRDDLSLNQGYRVGARYEELTQFVVRPGHTGEWTELVKLVIDAYKKGIPDAHWGTYEMLFGGGSTYLVITTLRSAEELDAEFAKDPKFIDALGPEGLKKLEALEASCVESRQSNLFRISPKMSYPPEALVQAEPDFWTPKP
ncbi:hypothetical protein [Tunturiibacter gelidoferens]|uniref:Uncharacterized protein n=1 Tax=Tunturiibacter gelidiferens TaxID=3069689 RepID=A0ACC5P096_9BACT|nr:hypothetical protein [Edaphobacter lichenicola]MBB5340272.1 hypothetical protein [Edaphobacter lichenicola]